MRGDADEKELERLEGLIDAYSRYKTQDELQKDNYADYTKKVNELREFDPEDYAALIKPFDPVHYAEQKRFLTELLIGMDERIAAERTEYTFAHGCQTMEKLGYILLEYNQSDPLVHEAIFVRSGCKGVAWQLIASDQGLQRKLIGIRREGGSETPPERVLEVARLEEEYGADVAFYDEYCGGHEGLEVTRSVLSDTEGSEEAIRRNGCVALNAAAAEKYDQLVGREDKRWASNLSVGYVRREKKDAVNCETSIEETARSTRAAIAQARRRET